MPQQQFKGYSDGQMKRIASKLGHKGDLNTFDGYLQGNPQAMQKFNSLNGAVTRRYAQGGDVNKYGFTHGGGPSSQAIVNWKNSSTGETFQAGSGGFKNADPNWKVDTAKKSQFISQPMDNNNQQIAKPLVPTINQLYNGSGGISTGGQPIAVVPPEGIKTTADTTLGQTTVNQSINPTLPTGTATQTALTPVTGEQLINRNVGQVGTLAPTATATTAATSTATAPETTAANLTTTETAAPAVNKDLAGVTAAQGAVSRDAQVDAAQQDGTSVSTLDAAQGTATQVEGAPTRTLEGGELVNPVADAQKAAAFTETITAAQADPSARATVQGQLATLMTSFDEGKTPAWAAGAMRNVTAQMAARGIGSSSMAGQALIQTALESALPIATSDAQTYATFEMTNLNNKQQRAMLSAQQRATFMGQEFDQAFQSRVLNSTKISEIANMQFTADQQIAIENAQLAGTMNLANLSNRQGLVMAEAAALSQMDTANLNNRQQAQVQNAKSFLDMDMTNIANEQQTTLFKAQQRTNALLSDTAARNAASQFNATSENQTDQFFSNLTSNISQFNATQKNAQSNFNAGEANSVSKFNTEVRNQRDQFNATNSLVINQSNAQWRRTVATADTAAVNRSNEINAKALLDISNTAYNNLWQEHRDEMDWAYKVAEGESERINAIVRATIAAEATIAVAGEKSEGDFWSSIGTFVGKVILDKD